MTRLSNLRHTKGEVYCGRGTPFGNPFEHGRDGTRDEVCDKYEEYFNKRLTDPEFRDKVLSLKGKVLECWCRCIPHCYNKKCKSLRCHCETIINYLNNL